jgi:hypothetical protein
MRTQQRSVLNADNVQRFPMITAVHGHGPT